MRCTTSSPVRDRGAIEKFLRDLAGASGRMGRMIAGPETAMGATLVFEPI